MADLTFGQQVAATALQGLAVAVGGGVSIAAGWVILRRQERVKRDEELQAAMRKQQADALVRILACIGKYHACKVQRLSWDDRDHPAAEGVSQDCFREEAQAYSDALVALADVYFLLGGELGTVVRVPTHPG